MIPNDRGELGREAHLSATGQPSGPFKGRLVATSVLALDRLCPFLGSRFELQGGDVLCDDSRAAVTDRPGLGWLTREVAEQFREFPSGQRVCARACVRVWPLLHAGLLGSRLMAALPPLSGASKVTPGAGRFRELGLQSSLLDVCSQ